MANKIFIRVDPDTTNVYSSEIRTTSEYWNRPLIINNSKKSLTEYLQIIDNNLIVKEYISSNKKILYNLYTSEAISFPKIHPPSFQFNVYEINKNSEILVSLPHLTPEYFVLCTDNSGIIINNTNDDYNNMPNLEENNANKKSHRRSRKKPCSTYTPPRCPSHCKVSSIDDSKCVWKKRKDRKKN